MPVNWIQINALQRGPIRDEIMERLKTHAGMSQEDFEVYRNIIIFSDYLSLPDHRGGSVGPTEKYYRRDGTQHTLEDVPLPSVVEGVESYIKGQVPAGKRTEVYHKVLLGVPGHKDTPEWDIPPESPNEEPVTPFSVRVDLRGGSLSFYPLMLGQKPSHVKSNKELLDALTSAADLDPSTASSLEIQVTWWDGSAGSKDGCMMSFTDGCKGGRLGRDHKFEDVPSNFVRDMLMDYVSTQLPEEKHRAAHKALCCDLTDDQIVEYLDLLAQAKEKREKEEREAMQTPRREAMQTPRREAMTDWQRKAKEDWQRKADEKAQSMSDEQLSRAQDLLAKSGLSHVYTLNEALNIVMLEEALDSVDDDISLIPLEVGITRNRVMPMLLSQSVVKPGKVPMDEESKIKFQSEVDWNCDQIRAMIKIFVSEGEWTLDEFRKALRSVSRQQLTSFLSKTGHDGPQKTTLAYRLSRNFFHSRDSLGLPLSGACISKDLAALEKPRRRKPRWQRVRDQERADRERARRQARAKKERAEKERAEKEKSPMELRGKRQKKNARSALDELVNEAKRPCVAQPRRSKRKLKT
jgi:hypothetical protein